MINEPFPTMGWYSMFHATISGDKNVYGSRVPAIWIYHNNGNVFLHINSAVNGNKAYEYDTPTTPIQLNKWMTIDISQSKVGDDYEYKVEFNGEVVRVVNNTQPQEFLNLKIYISDPWFPTIQGYVRNVIMRGIKYILSRQVWSVLCVFLFAFKITKRYNTNKSTITTLLR